MPKYIVGCAVNWDSGIFNEPNDEAALARAKQIILAEPEFQGEFSEADPPLLEIWGDASETFEPEYPTRPHAVPSRVVDDDVRIIILRL